MRCPFCNEDNDKVVDSRSSDQGNGIRRRRECLACNRRFTTYERPETAVKLTVVKKDGTRVPYDREKMLSGLHKACYKRPVSVEQLQEIVEDVEDQLFRTYEKEVDSIDIGRILCDHLKRVDHVAYVRFATVYKQFRDIEDLFDEVKEVIASKQPLEGPQQGRLF
ncbi:MAG: transcriptional repressor NrdR [Phycisphaera sp.]|nr:transcriptional repressor NrdR [Phycisphaera sp.]